MEILKTAYDTWLNGAEFRKRRTRLKNFTYGRQWDDLVIHPVTDEPISEFDAVVRETGHAPLTNNLIRRLVKTVVGHYRNTRTERSRGRSEDTVRLYELNRLEELDCRLLEEFLISGCAVQRISRECRSRGQIETFVDNVSPDDFFINSVRDPRGWDTRLIGMLHDMSVQEVAMRFAHGDPERVEQFRKIYDYDSNRELLFPKSVALGSEPMAENFFVSPTGRCRVIEVWTLDSVEIIRCHDHADGRYFELPASNYPSVKKDIERRRKKNLPPLEIRWEIITRWVGRWYAPDGTLLDSHVSASPDALHPFVVKLYPLTDGEIHSFVEDIVGQQQQINRLITLIDHIMSTSAKGLLLFPARSKPDSVTWEDISERWGRCGGVIPYNAMVGMPPPTQITSSGLDAGATGLLEIQMKMINDVSGVGDMLMGNDTKSGISAERYESQLRNAVSAITDILESFNDMIDTRDKKIKDA